MRRRAAPALVALVLAACSGAAATRSASTTAVPVTTTTTALPPTTTTLPPTTTTTTLPPGPARAVVLGDSLAYDVAPAIGAMLQAGGTGFTDMSFPGLGFTVTASDWNWRSAWSKVIADTQPDLVVFLTGPWDARDITVGGVPLVYGSPEWRAWYDGELDDFVRLVEGAGARLVWLTAPTYDPTSPDAVDLTAVNAAFGAVPTRWPGVEVVDTDAAVDAPDGSFAEYLPGSAGPEQVRKADGLHFCPAGAARVARALLPAVDHWWSLTPAAGWDAGPWRQDDRYVHPAYGPGCGA
jgi:hypothetical protein